MKIINTSKPDRKPLDQNQFLRLEIQRLEEDIGVKDQLRTTLLTTLPVRLQKEYLSVLENFTTAQNKFKKHEKSPEQQQSITGHKFTCFSSLPVELRLKIWGFAFASHLQPRVHCINVRITNEQYQYAKFISNHPVSSILHANQESRSQYLSATQLTFAFETYINFSTDIIYIADMPERRITFRKFLDYEASTQIQKLALRKDFFCALPLPGHMSNGHLEMMGCLTNWKQMIVIFEDYRSARQDTMTVFREFSAREKRVRAERSYARQQCKVLNSMMRGIGEPSMDFRFGQLESSHVKDNSIERLRLS